MKPICISFTMRKFDCKLIGKGPIIPNELYSLIYLNKDFFISLQLSTLNQLMYSTLYSLPK